MELTKEQESKITKFYQYLGTRFTEIEASSDGAPITVCARDEKGDEYWIRLEYTPTGTIGDILYTGATIENMTFYQMYALVSNNQSVFHIEMYDDGYALWFINDVTPQQMKVTDNHTMIGITSALHVEDTRTTIPTSFPL